ncbi:hypothetical protein JIG36_22145 [Actinoplanes sp. LDG1-06]|uniref:Uncharacterized protein n=1 Tax=Paractinoplanes ovalisporus TaxID=2810368 RepID=A0ABS2AEK8_9ACTN|nr:hypothetical protein [Actinoplanes ovalisporus]MBM2618265.1 hypothetical protein [Actinoplanes ovalisporus]
MRAHEDATAARFDAGRVDGPRPAAVGGTSRGNEGPELSAARPESGTGADFVDNIVSNPQSLNGRSAQDIADQFEAAGYRAHVEQSTKRGTSQRAQQVRIEGHPEITNIQVHPGGGRHTPDGSPYWKISTSTQGKTWVIPRDFRGADELGGNVVRYDE